MKAYTYTLLTVAESDLRTAELAVGKWPNQAAFHAQQCAEKSIKAAAFEFGEYKTPSDFEPIGKKVGHKSTAACVLVIRAGVDKGLKDAIDVQRQAMDEAREKGQSRMAGVVLRVVAWYSRQTVSHFAEVAVDKLFVDIEKGGINRRNYWRQSLNPDVDPGASNELSVGKPRIPYRTRLLLRIYRLSARGAGVKNDLPFDLPPTKDPKDMLRSLDNIASDFNSRGMKNVADGIERTKEMLLRTVGANFELFEWVNMVRDWTPYLDTHVSIARYPRGAQLDRYNASRPGVENLMLRSKLILELTKQILPLASHALASF